MKPHRISPAWPITLIGLLLALLSAEATAQTRPKVGLALSGGAAKGFAHIGVLKVLEEVGIVPDYITGTSMGSIMGGLYAIGYSPEALTRLSATQDWDLVLSDRIPLNEVIFEEKLFFRNQLIELPFRNGKIDPPTGLVHGQQIEDLLARLTLPVYQTSDFDSLPIPFHCMAADVVSGTPVELREGSLANAMRASMAIPTIFTPLEKDGMVLVDGGLIRNFPAKELKEMGADIIIGVYVGAEAKDAEKLRSFTKILNQIAFLTSIEDAEQQDPYLDIYIKPDLGIFGPADFKEADTIITLGEAAARLALPRLKALADSLNALGPPPAAPRYIPVNEVFIDSIEVLGNERQNRSEVLKWSGLQPGKTYTPEELHQAIAATYGTNFFQKVTYSLRRDQDTNILSLHCMEKAPLLIRASLIYDSYHEAGIGFGITVNNLLFPSSRFLFVGRLANNFRYRMEYLKYIGPKQRWFLNFSAQVNRDLVPIIQEGRLTEEYRLQEAPIELSLQKRIGNNIIIGFGSQLDLQELRPFITTTPLFDKLRYSNLHLLGFFKINSLDRNVLPTRGINLLLEGHYVSNLNYRVDNFILDFDPDDILTFSPYFRFTLTADSYIPLSRQGRLRLAPFAGMMVNSGNALSDFYFIGAPQPTSRHSIPFIGLDPNELVAHVALGTRLGYQHFLKDNLALTADINAGFFADPQRTEQGIPSPDIFLSGVGIGAIYTSFLGPIKLTIMHPLNDDPLIKNKLKAFLSVGHRF